MIFLNKIFKFNLDSKKNRRSRIIISDASEIINDNRKEIYDAETKIKKSIISAIRFNDSLNENRKETSKVFLKRKIKSAFEREPIDKTKGFFNVPFVPMPGMFSVIPPNQPPTGSLSSQQANRPINPSQPPNPNVPSKISNNPNLNPTSIQNLSQNDQTVVINMNKPKEEATVNPSNNQTVNINLKNIPVPVPVSNQVPQERSCSNIQNQTSNSVIQSVSQSRYLVVNTGTSNNKFPNINTKHLFNVNAGDNSKISHSDTQLKSQPAITNNTVNQQITTNSFNLNVSEIKENKHQINSNTNYNKFAPKNTSTNNNNNLNDEIHSNNTTINNQDGKICINLGQIQSPAGGILNLSQEDIKKLKPEQINQLSKIIRQKNQLQPQNTSLNNRSESNMNTANKVINAPSTQNTNSNNNLLELIRQQQNSIYMQAVECYKNDPEKFKSEKTTNELIKLQKLISMSKMQTDQNSFNNNNNNGNQFMTSNFIPKEGINSSYQLNLQLLQSIQKQLQRRDSFQNLYQTNNNFNNHPNNSTNTINSNISNNLNNLNISNISNPQISKTNQPINTTKIDLNFNNQN